MLSPRGRRFFFAALLGTCVCAAPGIPALFGAAAQREKKAAPAKVTVRLPEGARLFVDDEPLIVKGTSRSFETAPLEPGHKYHYVIRVEVGRDGETLGASRKIDLRAGETVTVDFRGLAPEKSADGKKPDKGPGKQDALKLSKVEQEILDLTNKERAKEGLPALRPNAKLFRAAREHSANMAAQGKLDHTLDDKGPAERLKEVGYRSFGWGENVAFGPRDAAKVIAIWMDSPGHRANILGEQFDEIGVGAATDDRGVPYYTQVFGRSPAR